MSETPTEEDIEVRKQHLELLRPYFVHQLIRTIIEKKLIRISYKKNGKRLLKFFELKNDPSTFYSDEEKIINVFSFVEDVHEIIKFQDIVMYEQTTENIDTDPFYGKRDKIKKTYCFLKETIKKLNWDYNLENSFFDSKLLNVEDLPYMICLKIENAREYYQPTPEEFDQHKQKTLELLKKEASKQKETITKEFNLLQQETPSIDSNELETILSFIDDIVQTTNFNEYKSVLEIFANWPAMFESPVAIWNHRNPWSQ